MYSWLGVVQFFTEDGLGLVFAQMLSMRRQKPSRRRAKASIQGIPIRFPSVIRP